ncbi:MAG: alpha/beta fold hydrolase [Deltaproteobacteria bacterium]|nr:alpha/beta fold hydrolase [Deltaproteobacteria bacterium]
MNLSKISRDTKSRRSALPYFLPGGAEAILAVHGYNGYSQDLLYVGEELNRQGFSVAIPRLPGHGTNASDFHETDGQGWLRHVTDCYFNLKAGYDTVHLLGFSMGGLLTLLLASRFPVGRMALISPAVMNVQWTIKLTPFLKYFVHKQKREWLDDSTDPDRLFLAQEYWQWHYIKMAAELLKLQKLTQKKMPLVSCDTMIIVSQKDEAVPVRAADYIFRRIVSPAKKTIVLENSPHCSTDGPEKELIAGYLTDWFKKAELNK